MKKFVFILLVTLALVYFELPAHADSRLSNMVVVLDPGHGGNVPGAVKNFGKGKTAHESSYCYDVSLRLEKILKSRGAIVIPTIRSKKSIIENHPQFELESIKDARFTSTNKIATGDKYGLRERVKIANQAKKKFNKRVPIFISIHFDSLKEDLRGVRIITGKNADKLSALLYNEFHQVKRETNAAIPNPKNGDKTHGIKNIYVISEHNQISQKVLIELGNFNNQDDLWRIRNPKNRQIYAELIANALVKLNKS